MVKKLNHKILNYGIVPNVVYKNNRPLYVINIEGNAKTGMSKQNIETIANKYVKQLSDRGQNFKVQLVLKSIKTGRNIAGKTSLSTGSVKLPELDPERYNSNKKERDLYEVIKGEYQFREIQIQLRPIAKADGGDKNNNCVWNCINTAYDGLFPKSLYKISTPIKFKNHFGLNPTDKFPKLKLQELSDLLEIQLQICGDETEIYGDYPRILHMKSVDGHMTLDNLKYKHVNNIEVLGIALAPKSNVIVYDYTTYESYDKDGYKESNMEYIKKVSTNAKYSADSILVKKTDATLGLLDLPDEATLGDIYDKFILVADNIKEASDDFINLYQCGTELKEYAFYLFNKSLRVKYNAEHIDAQEKNFLVNSGGLTFCKEAFEGEIFQYDLVKAYTSSLTNKSVTFPITRPNYYHFEQSKYIDRDSKHYYPYGEYKAIVQKSGNPNIDCLFRFSAVDTYTHTDLTRATQLGLKITLKDGINCALYEDRRIKGDELFGRYFGQIIRAENDNVILPEAKNIVKLIRNILWGALCEKNVITLYPDENGKTYVDDDIFEEIQRIPHSDNRQIFNITVRYKDQPFKTEFARIGAFLVSNLRNYISREIEKVGVENIIRCNTDGFYSKKELDLPISNNMNEYKLKTGISGQNGVGKIINCTNTVFPKDK